MLSKANRLTKHGSFNYVYRKGEKVTSLPLTVTAVRGFGQIRVGFVVSNKLGKAVVRNTVKRRLRAAMRELLQGVKSGGQVIVTVLVGDYDYSYPKLLASLKKALIKLTIIADSR